MPPSFPFGGMENPCITFVTPCLLAGDRSLADVIIHEISHSWFGNLVTNAHWGEFWLNEGFTMYAQRRISTELYGEWSIINVQCGGYNLAFSILATSRYVWLAAPRVSKLCFALNRRSVIKLYLSDSTA